MLLTQWLFGILLLADAGAAADTTIVVFPTEQFSKSQLARPLAAALVSKLRRPGWKVIDGTAVDRKKSFLKLVEDIVEGNYAKRALSVDADIYITFDCQSARHKDLRALQLAVQAYEPFTARQLASEMALSDPGPDGTAEERLALAMDACDRLVPAVSSQLERTLRQDEQTGQRYNIVIYNPPEGADIGLHPYLKKACRFVKTTRHENRLGFYSQCRASRKQVIGAIEKGIRKKLGGKKHTILPSPRQLIVITFR